MNTAETDDIPIVACRVCGDLYDAPLFAQICWRCRRHLGVDDLEQDTRDLAAALETLIAAMLIGATDPERATKLVRAAQSMAAAIRTGDTAEPAEPPPQA